MKIGREWKICEFYEELFDCLGDNFKIILVVIVFLVKVVVLMN